MTGDGSGIFAAQGTAGVEPPPPRVLWRRAALVHAGFLLFALALIGRAAQVQLVERDAWRARARAQQIAAAPLPAPRGTILDVNGQVLVETRQLVKIAVAPREVAADTRRPGDGARRMAELTRTLARAGVKPDWVARVRDTSRTWVEVPGQFLASDLGRVASLRGVYATPALDRVPPANDGLRRLIGRADDAGQPVDGLEKSLDAVLRGSVGREMLVRDARGQRIRSPNVAVSAPTPGHTVVLTINQGLQDIAERALSEAITELRATGGDIVMLDPATGEVRALASRREDRLSAGATALTEPYEPGSTLKPFVAARLLDLGRARADEIVNTHNGKWEINGRKIVDDHAMPQATVSDVIRYSSNIGIIQLADRLSAGEKFELYRDLGFGSPTGVAYPVESPGVLPVPRRWDGLTSVSLAMGYAVTVTPIQLAAAYGAIANGGELLEPALVREIRAPGGAVTWRRERRVLRRVMSPVAARALRGMLRGVVEAGTATGSNLSTFDIAGKTGTAKVAVGGRYVEGRYTASFVGMFPAESPQLVILVKLDNPKKTIYGGRAAAPVTRAVLEAALSARDAALDRTALAVAARPHAGARAEAGMDATAPGAAGAAAIPAHATVVDAAPPPEPVASEPAGRMRWVADLGEPHHGAAPVVARRAVPDVRGLPVRRAVYELHRAGFRASLPRGGAGADRAAGTLPTPGTYMPTGSVVVLEREP